MGFAELLDAALAGTVRHDPPAALPGLADRGREERLLRGASFEGLRRLAGRPLERVPDVAVTEPAPMDTRPEVPPAAAARLADILDDRRELLAEWLALAAVGRLRVPYELLPELLEHARADPGLATRVAAVGGTRLAWLAAQNPAWSFAAPGDSADEATLETMLHEGDRRVRATAVRLLARLPGSAFGQRWAARARGLLSMPLDRDGAEPDPAWVADGLEPAPPKGIGQTAWLIQQVVGLAPPSTWPADVLDATSQGEWAEAMRVGLALAAERYGDQAWLERLLAWHLLSAAPPAAVAGLAAVHDGPWSLGFSRFVIARLPLLIKGWQYAAATFVRDARLRLDPLVLPEAEQLLEAHVKSRQLWVEPTLERLVDTLDYRQAMRQDFAAP
jgi:hypothetical protein